MVAISKFRTCAEDLLVIDGYCFPMLNRFETSTNVIKDRGGENPFVNVIVRTSDNMIERWVNT